MRRIALLCSIAVAAVASGAVAAPQKAPAKKPVPAAAKPAPKPAPAPAAPWKPVPYPGSTSALPAGYKGADAWRFLTVFKAAETTTKKDEFETTAAYEARMANASSAIAPIDMQATYAFAAEVKSQYDADKQEYTFTQPYNLSCGTESYVADKAPVVCVTQTERDEPEEYEAQNGYGAKFTVTKIRGREVGVVMPRSALSHREVFENPYGNSFKIKRTLAMPLDQASQLRTKTIAMLYVGRIDGTKKVNGPTMLLDATSARPRDVFVYSTGLPFAPTEIVFYVVETGQILDAVPL